MHVRMYDGKQQLVSANLLGVAWPLAPWGGSLSEGGRRMSDVCLFGAHVAPQDATRARRYISNSFIIRSNCDKNGLFRKCSKSHMKTQHDRRSRWPQYGFKEKNALAPSNIAIFDHGACRWPFMRSIGQNACDAKMSNLSFQQIIFLRMKPILGCT